MLDSYVLAFPSERLALAGRRLRIDAVTAEVSRALRDTGVESILLKGPSFDRWLFDDDARSYTDTDLLVAPDDRAVAEDVLAHLGFPVPAPAIRGDRPWHARMLVRERDSAVVDLHTSLLGVELDPTGAWPVWLGTTEWMTVAGQPVRVLSEEGRTVHVALHAAQHRGHPLRDLERALGRLAIEDWRVAGELAARLNATDAFAAGLSALPQGRDISSRLALPTVSSVDVLLRASDRGLLETDFGLAWDWLSTRQGLAERVSYVVRKLIPPPGYMREWSPLARRGRVGLAAAYLWRVVWIFRWAPTGWRAWRIARSRVDETSS